MKPTIIKLSNKTAIANALASVQGKATVHCEDFDSLQRHAATADRMLTALEIRQAERVGAQYSYTPAGPDALNYTFAQGATSITIVRRATGWALTAAERVKVFPRQSMRRVVILTEPQKHAHILRRAEAVGLVIDLAKAREVVMRESAAAARAACALVLSGAVAVKPLDP